MSDYDREMTAAAFEHAWTGYQDAEFAAANTFGIATAYLSADPEQTGEGDEVVSVPDGVVMTSQESVTVWRPTSIVEVLPGKTYAVELGQLMTITTIMSPRHEMPEMEIVVVNRAAVLDTSFEPPMPTGEEYVRPPVTLVMTGGGEDVADMHFTSPERPDTMDVLLELREDQKRYTALLDLVVTARVARGEIDQPEV
jgi:hypothetical protein